MTSAIVNSSFVTQKYWISWIYLQQLVCSDFLFMIDPIKQAEVNTETCKQYSNKQAQVKTKKKIYIPNLE